MGYAQILGSGSGREGRYTIQLDYGRESKQAIANALNISVANQTVEINKTQAAITVANAREDALRQEVANQLQVVVDSTNNLPPGSPYPDITAYKFALSQLAAEIARNQPLHITLRSQQAVLKNVQARVAEWNTWAPTEVRDVWCVTYTESGSGVVATIEIPGEPNLVLLAPECRVWSRWDGSIRSSTKNPALSILMAQRESRVTEVNELTTEITALEAEAAVLRAAEDAARQDYIADPSEYNRLRYEDARRRSLAKQDQVNSRKARKAAVQKQIDEADRQIGYWSSKRGDEDPQYGDGVLTARQLLTPSQAFYLAALLPGWQAHLPTYRWGTITAIDWDNDECSVTLGSAVSSANSLGVNDGHSSLSDVPVTYMQCDARGFGIGDRVIVQFEGLSWERPRVIGYLDNPLPCPPKKIINVPDMQACATFDEIPSLALSAFFSAGYGARTYEVVSGSLPPGITLDPTTGILSGTPTGDGNGGTISYLAKVRCSDSRYIPGENRRYDDSNEFEILVSDDVRVYRTLNMGHVFCWDVMESEGFADALLVVGGLLMPDPGVYQRSTITFYPDGGVLGGDPPWGGGAVTEMLYDTDTGSGCLVGHDWYWRLVFGGPGIGPKFTCNASLNSWQSGFPSGTIRFRAIGASVDPGYDMTLEGSFTLQIALGAADESAIVWSISGAFGLRLSNGDV